MRWDDVRLLLHVRDVPCFNRAPQFIVGFVFGNHHTNYDFLYSHGYYAISGIIYLTDSEVGTVFTKLGIKIYRNKYNLM